MAEVLKEAQRIVQQKKGNKEQIMGDLNELLKLADRVSKLKNKTGINQDLPRDV